MENTAVRQQQSEAQFPWTIASLRRAFKAVQAKNARGGIDRRSVEHYAEHLDERLAALLTRLQAGTYVPDPYEQIAIQKDDGGERVLSLATVEDKIVQVVVKEYLEQRAKPLFLDCSYAYRPGKGHGKAIGRVSHYLRKDSVVMPCDIDNYFDSINHATLFAQLETLITANQLMNLLRLWITTAAIHKGRLMKRTRGIAQGGIISPVLSNIYLATFDRFMVSLGLPYVRYADNFILIAQDRKPLDELFTQSKDFLASQLSLQLNEKIPPVYTHAQGFDFLGIHFQSGRRTIAPRKFEKARREIVEIFNRKKEQPFDTVIELWERTLAGWRRYYGTYDVKEQFTILQENLTNALVSDLVRRHCRQEFDSVFQMEQRVRSLRPLLEDARGWHERVIAEVKERYTREAQETRAEKARVQKVCAARSRKFIHLHVTERDLVVSSPGSFVGKQQGKLQVKSSGTVVREVPARSLQGVLLGARGVALSTDAIKLCVEKNIGLSIVDGLGRPVATIAGITSPHFAISAAQVDASACERGGVLAFNFAAAKVKNQASLLRYYAKYHSEANATFQAALKEELPRLDTAVKEMKALRFSTADEYRASLLGFEGAAGAAYWRCVRALIGTDWGFEQREHQGASNIVNKMLNYGYGVLTIKVFENIVRRGLNPLVSFLHTPRPDAPTLVFDVMEQFRPTMVDGVIITMLLRKEKLHAEGELLGRPLREKIAQRVLAKWRTEFTYRRKRQTPEEILDNQLRNIIEYVQRKTERFRPYSAKW